MDAYISNSTIYQLRLISPVAYHIIKMAGKSFIVTLKDSVPEGEVSKFKESIDRLGGSITHEFSLIKGFTVKLPEELHINKLKDSFGSIISNVEEDKEVSIKK